MQAETGNPTRAHRADVDTRAWRDRPAAGRRSAQALGMALALFAFAPAPGATREFAAEAAYVASETGPKSPAGVPPEYSAKLYVGKDKMRIDFAGMTRQSLIVDDGGHAIVALFHDRKAYQELATRPAEYFRVADPDDACPAWQQAVGRPIRCQKTGVELAAGRKAIRYTRSLADGGVDEIWVDPRLEYVVKWRIDEVAMELRNISEGPQPDELFTIPGGYLPVGPRNAQHRQARHP